MFIMIAIMLAACSQSSKFKIKDVNGNIYRTDRYEMNDSHNCIKFTCGNKIDRRSMTICGSFIIETNE